MSLSEQMPRRVAFYSHDTVGLGHTRRNLGLAAALVEAWPDIDVLIITGNPEATTLGLPPHTDVVTLPTISKDAAGEYQSRALNSPLSLVIEMRRRVIDGALTAFEPDLLVVDKVPLGVGGELLPALRTLSAAGGTKIVLGLREILDDPVSTVREWEAMGTTSAIAQFYDQVWVYGDQAVYDPVVEYGLPPVVANKTVYTGYLSHGRIAAKEQGGPAAASGPESPYILCLVGGGQDGYQLADSFARTQMPAGHRGIILTGPFMNADSRLRLRQAAAANPALTVHDFLPDAAALVDRAAAVVSMAGYNSACEILATATPALFVPRTTPRTEQQIRARRLTDHGLADMIDVDQLTSPWLARWLAAAVQHCDHGSTRAKTTINLAGLDAVPALAATLVRGLDHVA
jgi:predicted glycosyltransferase